MAKKDKPAVEPKPARVDGAPDPARVYGRERPESEAGMGRLDNNSATPYRSADKLEETVRNRQENRQINAEDEETHHKKK
jgi:hypothetical protein